MTPPLRAANSEPVEKEPAPCPFCGASMTSITNKRPYGPHYSHPNDNCFLVTAEIWPGDHMAYWNRRSGRTWNEAIEAAAKECDGSAAMWGERARGGDNSRASDFRQEAAEQLAEDIRALKEPEQ